MMNHTDGWMGGWLGGGGASGRQVSVSGATVDLSDANGALAGSTTTSQSGEFSLDGLQPGMYTMVISNPNSLPMTISGITAFAGDIAQMHAVMMNTGPRVNVDYQAVDCRDIQSNTALMNHVNALSQATGVPVAQIVDLRQRQCLGWDMMGHQLGASPSTMGLGQMQVHGGHWQGAGSGSNQGASSGGNQVTWSSTHGTWSCW